MALYHDATITPTKAELLIDWVPTQSWCPDSTEAIEVIGAFRFDDPEGRVGMETHLVKRGDTVLHVPLTYREEPVADMADALITEMQHSALGTRWVYDALNDPRYLVMLAGVTLTGQGEALGMVEYGGKWFIAPAAVRIHGGGWTQERVSVDDLEPQAGESSTRVFRNDQFELTVYRQPSAAARSNLALSASWAGASSEVVLAQLQER